MAFEKMTGKDGPTQVAVKSDSSAPVKQNDKQIKQRNGQLKTQIQKKKQQASKSKDSPQKTEAPKEGKPSSGSTTKKAASGSNDVRPKKVVTIATPPDGGWGWVVVLSSFFISVLVDGVCFSFGIFFDEFRHEFDATKATTSWVGSVLNGSYLIGGPIVSALVNMYGCRVIAVFGAFLSGCAFFVSTFSTNVGLLIFTYGFIGGVGFGLMYLPAIVMVGYYFEKRRALATGIACCGSGIGAFVFAPVSEYLLQEYGWRGATWILSALVFHGMLVAMFYRPLIPTKATAPANQDPEKATTNQIEEQIPMLSLPDDITNNHGIDVEVVELLENDNGNTKNGSACINEDLKASILDSLKIDDFSSTFRQRSMTMSSETPATHRPKGDLETDLVRLAYSQDFGPIIRAAPEGMRSRGGSRPSPMDRKDLFYSGSLWHLKEYQQVGSMEEFRENMQVVHNTDDGESSSSSSGAKRNRVKDLIRGIRDAFDLSLLKSPTFLIYGTSCFLCMAGFFVPFIYMPTHAIDLGYDTRSAALLISAIGITNTVGRVAVGFVSDLPKVDCLLFNNVALIIGGIATVFVPYYPEYFVLAIYSVVFGAAIAVFVSLRSIIMVELMGLDKLTNAFGFVIMCQGLSSLIGPPVAGALADSTGNYNAAFYMAGVTLTLSGIICLPLRRVAQWESGREGSSITGAVKHKGKKNILEKNGHTDYSVGDKK